MDKISKQYTESKKVSKVEEKKREVPKTFEKRMAYYLPYQEVKVPQEVKQSGQVEVVKPHKRRKSSVCDWAAQVSDKASRMVSFLWEKKSAIGIGMLVFAGRLGSAEGRFLGESTALRLMDRSNTTLPALGWEGFNNLSHPTALHESHPSRVTPEVVEHLKKLGVLDPGQLIRNVQQGRYENETSSEQRGWKENKGTETRSSKKKQIAKLRALMKKAETDPKARERVRQLLAEKQQLKEQKSFVPRRELATDTPSVVLVHGLNGPSPKGSSAGHDCNNVYWIDTKSFLKSQGLQDLRTIQFYTGDRNCDANLHDPSYTRHCTDFSADVGLDGTNDESIYHLSCLLAQYLYQNFGQSNKNVVLVGHSMGGIIVRETLFQMQQNAGQSPFPDTIGHVTDAITFNTPHGGLDSATDLVGSLLVCNDCTQWKEMSASGNLMSELASSGQNPQTSGGFTRWTVIGSECDGYVAADDAIYMHANHAVVYAKGSPDGSCYDHSGAIHDQIPNQDAYVYYCDKSDPDNSPCGTGYRSTSGWVRVNHGPHGLPELYNAILGAPL
jgi:pimeloyl-ACP methyl ester carboxylesterase